MKLDSQQLEFVQEYYEGSVVKPEGFLTKRWGSVPSRTGWCSISITSKKFKKILGLSVENDNVIGNGVQLRREFLEEIEKLYTRTLTDAWSTIKTYLYISPDETSAILLEDHWNDSTPYLDINCFYHLGNKEDDINCNKLIDIAAKYLIKPEDKPQVYLIGESAIGYDLDPFEFEKFDIDIDANYEDGFREKVHEPLINFAKSKRPKNGRLVLFHGDPGTGKTYYIRNMISEIANTAKTIYVPVYMLNAIAEPKFIDFLREQGDSVLVIEDAEEVLVTEGSADRNTAISNLLQVTEGILSDCLKLKFICTFNTDESFIDKALMRKGRLALIHKFKPLSMEKARKKALDLGVDPAIVESKIIGETTIADVYNLEHENRTSEKEEKRVGFHG